MRTKLLGLLGLLLLASALVAAPNTSILFDAFNPTAGTFVYCDIAAPQGLPCTTGAAAGDGWLRVVGLGNMVVVIRPDTVSLTAGSIQFTIEGRFQDRAGNWATMVLIAPIDFAAAQAGHPVALFENVEEIRVGVRINGTDDAVDDSVTVHFNGGQ